MRRKVSARCWARAGAGLVLGCHSQLGGAEQPPPPPHPALRTSPQPQQPCPRSTSTSGSTTTSRRRWSGPGTAVRSQCQLYCYHLPSLSFCLGALAEVQGWHGNESEQNGLRVITPRTGQTQQLVSTARNMMGTLSYEVVIAEKLIGMELRSSSQLPAVCMLSR